VDKDDCASRIESGPYGVIDVIAHVSWLVVDEHVSIHIVKARLTGFVPGTVRRRDSNTYRSELVEYIWDKLERTYKTATTLER
jgi:hypothetical protein